MLYRMYVGDLEELDQKRTDKKRSKVKAYEVKGMADGGVGVLVAAVTQGGGTIRELLEREVDEFLGRAETRGSGRTGRSRRSGRSEVEERVKKGGMKAVKKAVEVFKDLVL